MAAAVKFTPQAASKIAAAVRIVLSTPIDQRGSAGQNRTSANNCVLVFITGSLGRGCYTGNLATGAANGSSGSSVAGLGSGTAVLIINGPEYNTGSTYPYITTPIAAPVPGVRNGFNGSGGLPIVFVSVTSLGAC